MKNGRMQILSYGTKHWYLNNKLHRTDGPAVEIVDGYKEWYLNGQRHRTDGPAIEWVNGYKGWWLNGKRHRTDGPAVEHPNGNKEWYLNGEWYGSGEIPPVDYTLAALAYEGMSHEKW